MCGRCVGEQQLKECYVGYSVCAHCGPLEQRAREEMDPAVACPALVIAVGLANYRTIVAVHQSVASFGVRELEAIVTGEAIRVNWPTCHTMILDFR